MRSTASGTSSSRRRPTARFPSRSGPTCTAATPTGSRTSSPASFLARSEIIGYHLEQSVRYRTELWPATAETAALARRAAGHLETAGYGAHDRGDDVAAVNLLERAGTLLPGDAPVLGRL